VEIEGAGGDATTAAATGLCEATGAPTAGFLAANASPIPPPMTRATAMSDGHRTPRRACAPGARRLVVSIDAAVFVSAFGSVIGSGCSESSSGRGESSTARIRPAAPGADANSSSAAASSATSA
jgi:hypothetical protein